MDPRLYTDSTAYFFVNTYRAVSTFTTTRKQLYMKMNMNAITKLRTKKPRASGVQPLHALNQ
jgi:hypothetical protein